MKTAMFLYTYKHIGKNIGTEMIVVIAICKHAAFPRNFYVLVHMKL